MRRHATLLASGGRVLSSIAGALLAHFGRSSSAAAITATASPGQEAAKAHRGVRVLLVEDEPLIAISGITALEGAGYLVCGVAAASKEALRLAEAHAPVLALVDVQLADGRTGLALAGELQRRFGTLCVLTTAFLADDEQAEHEAYAFLEKPYSSADLLAQVDTSLRSRTLLG